MTVECKIIGMCSYNSNLTEHVLIQEMLIGKYHNTSMELSNIVKGKENLLMKRETLS